MNNNANSRYALPSNVLLILGLVDLVRGILHTFFVVWAAKTFAKLDLSVARQDQLTLLGAFGISNLLTGLIYILISRKAKSLSTYVLLMIPCAYALGKVGLKTSGVTAHAAFFGKYFMFGYLGVCLVTVALSILLQRNRHDVKLVEHERKQG